MPDTQGVQEIYADFAQITAEQLGIFLAYRTINATSILLLDGDDPEPQWEASYGLKTIVRMTREDAKIFTIMLKRALKGYEQESGEILLPPGYAAGVNLEADEW